jgi:hypothetical protein
LLGFKGVLRVIGAAELGAWGGRLEQAGKAARDGADNAGESKRVCETETAPFVEALSGLRARVRAAVPPGAADETATPAAEPPDLKAALSAMREACAACRPKSARKAAEHLARLAELPETPPALQDALREIAALSASFEYESALAKTQAALAALSS